MNFLDRRGFNLAKFEAMPHGIRAKYAFGCRCQQCRTANTAYEKVRNYKRQTGDWNGLVSARKARQHLLKLSLAGVGRGSVRNFGGISESVLNDIRTGRKRRIRSRTERRILAITPAHALPGARVAAVETRKRIAWLIHEGFTRAEIARRIGARTPKLQTGSAPTITVENADRIERVWREFQE